MDKKKVTFYSEGSQLAAELYLPVNAPANHKKWLTN
jgi:hypothetical protein